MNPQELTDKELNAFINTTILAAMMQDITGATDELRKKILNLPRAQKEQTICELFELVGITPNTTMEEMKQLEERLGNKNDNEVNFFTSLFSFLAS